MSISDLKLSHDEVQLLGGISDVWGWDWEDCIDMIHCIIENFQNDNSGKIVRIEEKLTHYQVSGIGFPLA